MRLQVLAQMEKVQDVELLVLVNVQDLEAQVQQALLVITFEWQEERDELNQCYLDTIVSLSHPKVEALAEVRLIYPNHMLDVLHEVRFC